VGFVNSGSGNVGIANMSDDNTALRNSDCIDEWVESSAVQE